MQVQLCREYVESQNGEVSEVLADEFYSGANTDRPGFRKLMDDLESGRAKWDCVCVYKLSRITRSLRDGAEIFEKFYKWNKGFISITEKNLDFSTPSGRAMLGILQVFNQFEREQTVENTRNKMISIAAGGGWPVGNPPFGYERHEKHDNKLYLHPRNAEAVRQIFEQYAGDVPLFKIAKAFCKTPQGILHVLRNEVYLGKVVYAGQVFKGMHDPIITPEIFFAVKEKMQKNIPEEKIIIRVKQQKYPYLLAGLLRCHCGRYMTPESAKSGSFQYYRCTDNVNCKQRVSAKKVEEWVLDRLRNLEISEEFRRGAIESIREMQKISKQELAPQIENASKALREAQKEQEKTYRLLLSDKLDARNSEFVNQRLLKLNKEVSDLTARISYLRTQRDRAAVDHGARIEAEFRKFSRLSELFKNDSRDKSAIIISLKTYVESVSVTKDGEYCISLYHNLLSGTSVQKSGSPARI